MNKMQLIIVNETESREDQLAAGQHAESDLILYFGRPIENEFSAPNYLDYSSEQFVVHIDRTSRKRGPSFRDMFGYVVTPRTSGRHVARVYAVTHDQGGVLYLPLLLHHQPARSFEDIRTHHDTVYSTFQDAATDLNIRIPTLPPQYIDFFGCLPSSSATLASDIPQQAGVPQQAEACHPNQHADGGWIEAKGPS